MPVPVFQQKVGGHGTTTFSAQTFSNPTGSGNGLIVAFDVVVSSGTISAMSISDNNGNSYISIFSNFNKTSGYAVFKCTNPLLTPHSTLAITGAGTFSGGAGVLTAWSLVAAEWNNVNTTNIVSAITSATSAGTTLTLTSQPAGTTAVGIGLGSDSNSSTDFIGPPTWTLRVSDLSPSGPAAHIADSENFAAGTVKFLDNGSGSQPTRTVLIVLAASTTPPGAPWFLQQEQIENSYKRKH